MTQNKENDDDPLDLYNTYRDYIEHENDLINSRLTWTLTCNGFLFAAYGLSIQKITDISQSLITLFHDQQSKAKALCYAINSGLSLHILELNIFVVTIVVIGFIISVYAFRSIRSAQTAVHSLNTLYTTQNISHYKSYSSAQHAFEFNRSNVTIVLPAIVGGGAQKPSISGHFLSQIVPIALAVAWCVIFAFSVIDLRRTLVRFPSDLATVLNPGDLSSCETTGSPGH